MSVKGKRGVVRNANRMVNRIRDRVSTALYRTQLGPGREADIDLIASQTWHNHRSL
jgi:hypothetical protein